MKQAPPLFVFLAGRGISERCKGKVKTHPRDHELASDDLKISAVGSMTVFAILDCLSVADSSSGFSGSDHVVGVAECHGRDL